MKKLAPIVLLVASCSLFPMGPLEVQSVATDPRSVTVEFSRPPDPARAEAAFLLQEDGRTVYGRMTIDDRTMVFHPERTLDFEKPLRVNISTRAEDLHGNALRVPFLYRFGRHAETAPLHIEATEPSNTIVALSFSEPIRPEAVYGHVHVIPDGRYRIDFDDAGQNLRFEFLSAIGSPEPHTIRIADGLTGARGGTLEQPFEYHRQGRNEPADALDVVFSFVSTGHDSVTAENDTNTFEEFTRDTNLHLTFTKPVRADDLPGAIRIDPRTPVEIDAGAGAYLTEATIRFPGQLDHTTEYQLTVGARVQDIYGQSIESPRSVRFRAREESFRQPVVEAMYFDGLELVDGGVLDLSDFAPHTARAQAEFTVLLRHAEHGGVAVMDLVRHFRVRAHSGSARFSLIAATGEAMEAGRTRFRIRVAVLDEAGRFGIVSLSILRGLTDTIGNVMETEWRVNLNQTGGPPE